MKDLKVLSVLIRLDGGGAERSVSRMVAPLAERNVELLRYPIDPALPGEESDPGRTLTADSHGGLLRVLRAALEFSRAVRKERPDVVHLNCEAPELVGFLARLITPFQTYGVVVTDHSMKSWSGARRALGLGVRFVFKKFGALYVDCFKPDVQDSGSIVILNPTGDAAPLKPGIPSKPRLLVVGRLIESKRVEQVLEAASLCRWPHKIVIVGDGAAAGDVRARVSQLELDVDFLGHQKDPWSSATAADIFVSASAYEGEPLTLIEAIQRSLPVLASDIPGHVKVLSGHSGIFSSVAELSTFLSACISGRSVDQFRIADRERIIILTERDPLRISKQWKNVYEKSLVQKAIRAS